MIYEVTSLLFQSFLTTTKKPVGGATGVVGGAGVTANSASMIKESM